jgi:hypothetical protein
MLEDSNENIITYANLEVNLDRRSHGRLDEHLSNVLPLLLKKRRQKVSRQLSVDNDLLFVHINISNSNVKAHDLFHLELDGRLDLVNLLLHVLSASKKGGELTSLSKTGSQKTGDLLDHVVRGKEEVILLGKLLHQLFVFVELLKILGTHVSYADTIGLLTMGGISEHAALDVGTGDGRKTEGSGESLVTLRIVVLKGDLDLNGFSEVTLLSLEFLTTLGDGFTGGEGQDVLDGLVEEGGVQLV